MRIVPCTFDRHAPAILEIFNEAILKSTALYDYEPRTIESMEVWFTAKTAGFHPVIGVEDERGLLMGFASYGPFRAWPAYKYSVEHSVYVHKDHRGKGLGLTLMRRIIECAGGQEFHTLIGGIDESNTPSIALHKKLGFVHAGTIKHAGYKFGRWLDLGFYQLVMDTPVQPTDG